MGNCLIKGSQTCSQTCPSLAPVEVDAHHSFESESVHKATINNYSSDTNALVYKYSARDCLDVQRNQTFLSLLHPALFQILYLYRWFILIMFSHMQRNILGFSCFYSSTPIGGNIIILTKVSLELCRVSQV